MGPADRGGGGGAPLLGARGWRREGEEERGLRVPAELRFPSHVENKRQELKAFLLVIHGES